MQTRRSRRGANDRKARGLGRVALATAIVAGSALAIDLFVLPTPVADAAPLCATPPTSGTQTISGVVNTYYPAVSSIAAGTLNTSVTVGASRGAAAPLAVGDLVLVIQMQGADINATNSDAYGDGTATDGIGRGLLTATNYTAGLYEYARVSSVAGSTIGLTGAGTNDGLVNSYVNANATAAAGQRRFQLVRVPQFFDATLGGAVTAAPWDGASGGIVAVDAAATLNLNSSSINVTGQGFRGGDQRARGGSGAAGLADTDWRTPTSAPVNGQKAEGVAGSPVWRTGSADNVGDGYPNGDFGRGAPGNAGGGGTDGDPPSNAENSGGGGGGNGGTGGTGGNTWSSNLAVGGNGGATFASSVSRVVLGGGGGAGSDNNQVLSSAGGAGGGLVMIRAGALSGTGTITANGTNGSISGQDAGGGGGAGGTIVVLSGSGIGGLTMNANGGNGGNTTFGNNNNGDRHGPGGGGGGGRIILSAAAGTRTVAAGTRGIHTPTNDRYGATSGTAGSQTTNATLAQVPGANTGSQCIDVSVTKVLNTSPLVPGNAVSYTITVTNNGPFPATGATTIPVVDTFPAGLSSISWSCSTSAPAPSSCAAATGTGNINTTVNLVRGASATFAVNATLAPGFTGTLSNTATANAPTGVVDFAPLNNTSTASAVAQPTANLSIDKNDGANTVSTPGTNVTYTVTVSNAGPSTATNAIVTDALPAGTTSGTWSCTSGPCGASSGTMPMNTTVTLAPTQTAVYSVTVAVSSSATGSLTNSATVTAPAGTTDPNPNDNTDTDPNTLTPRADLAIVKTDGQTTRVAGEANQYSITVTNAGPSTITNATVTDTFPAIYLNPTWVCTPTPGSSCPASGSGNINATVTVAPAGQLTFVVDGTISPTAPAGTLSNTATVALPGGAVDPTPGNNTWQDDTTIVRSADLSITKTDGAGVDTEVPGTTVTYTIVASNAGPSTATNATVQDVLPGILGSASWTCTASPGSSCPAGPTAGDINATVTLAPGGTATFTLTATIAPGATGTLVNSATVIPPADTPDPVPGDNTRSDTDTLVPTADLSVTKTDSQTSDVPGTSISYTVVASNAGPSTATGATLSDTLPAGLTGIAWTCLGANGGTCPASGSGNPVNALVTLPPGGTATFTITADIDPGATATLSNTATITAPGGVTDPDPGDNSDTDTTTLTPTGDLSITKTNGVGVTTLVPGTTTTYTIVASNAGPSTMTAVAIADPIPADLTGATWTCTAAGGASCPAPTGSGDISATVTLVPGASLTYAVTGTVAAGATGTLANTATITAGPGTVDPDGGNNTATDTDTLTPTADVSITKDDGVGTAVPGQTVTYTITAANAGPSDAPGTVVSDTFPAALTGVTWSCVAAGGATCPTPATGSGAISASVDLPTGGSVTFTAVGTVVADATGSLTNTATASVAGGVTDPNTDNNADTDVDTLTPTADLVITKTDGAISDVPGTSIAYTVVVTNTGPSTVTGATVSDTLPAALTGATWTCTASAGSSCSTGAGSGSLVAVPVTLLPGGTATFTITADIAATATGTLTNTATVAAPSGVTETDTDNNTATDTTDLVPTADLSVTKTDGAAVEIPGTGVVYTIVVTNDGPSDVSNATVTDILPAALLAASWACSADPGSNCDTPAGSGSIATTIDLQAGDSATFTLVATIAAGATGNLANTVDVAVPGGVVDPNGTNDSATDTDTLQPTADLSITKNDGVTAVSPGESVTYTIVAANAGPSSVVGATVTDLVPAALTGVTWSCTGAAGGSCSPASGSGNVNAAVTLPLGGTVTFTLTGTVAATATGTLENTATIAAPPGVTDPDGTDDSATDTDQLEPVADLSITKTNPDAVLVPGTGTVYTITASNAGPAPVTGARVTDGFPATLVAGTWTCTPAGGAACPAGGSGNVDALVDIPAGGSVTFTVNATVVPTATGSVTNTATVALPAGVTDPDAGDLTATVTIPLTPVADLSITKDDASLTATPGGSTTYTVIVTNGGPSAVTAAPVTDPLPAGALSGTWTCAPALACAATAGTMPLVSAVTLAPNASATYTVTVAIDPAASGTLANTATVAAPGGVTDPDPSDNDATDTDTLTPDADLVVTKTSGLTTVVNGQTITYAVTVTNAGPSSVDGVDVDDPIPAALTGVSWTCTATAGSSCPAGGTGSLADVPVDLGPGGTATFTITGTVGAAATGTIENTATATMPSGITDPTPGNNTATDSVLVAPETDLSITKTTVTGTLVPGETVEYEIVATNLGPADAPGTRVRDLLPVGATAMSWTCTAAAGATCSAPAGAGPLDSLVDLPVGGEVTFAVTVTIDPAATGSLVNTAAVIAPGTVTDTEPGNDADTVTDPLVPRADLEVTKTDGVDDVVPGTSTTYTIVVTNAGPSVAPAARVVDPAPAGGSISSWSCTAGAGASCSATSGSGAIDTTVGVPVGGSVTFEVTVAVDPGATAPLANTVTVTPGPGVTDPDGATATDTDDLTPEVDLAITKVSDAPVVPGETVTYTLVVTNDGPSAVAAARVTDDVDARLTGVTWSCTPGTGGTCPSPATGTGDLDELVDLAVGGEVTFEITGDVPADATGNLANAAQVAPPTGTVDTDPSNDEATVDDPLVPTADLGITKTDGVTSAVAGATVTYTITATNAGPSDSPQSVVADTFPAAVTAVAWTCVASGTTCPAPNGTGDINATVDLPVGASITYTAVATIAPDATGPLANVATVAAGPGVTDPAIGDNLAEDTDTLGRQGDLLITKDSGLTTAVPGTDITYLVIARNLGPSTITGASVTDTLPAGIVPGSVVWSCAATAGSSCAPSGTGDIAETVDLAPNGTATFTVTGRIDPAATGTLSNTARVAGPTGTDPDPSNDEATDDVDLTPRVDLVVEKTNPATSVTPGASTVYTVTVANAGPSFADDAVVTDALPSGATSMSWTCTATAGSTCPASGSGAINATVDLAPAGTLTFTVTVQVPASATGTITNTASATPADPLTELTPGDNTDSVTLPLVPGADLRITKTDGATTEVPGTTVTYTIVATNVGPSAIAGATVTDTVPATLSGVTWTCAAAGGATCTASGAGSIVDTVDLPVGATATYTLTAAIAPDATGTLANTATVTLPPGSSDPVPDNNSATDTDTLEPQGDLSAVKTVAATSGVPGTPITYSLVVANTGPSTATNALVNDALPASLTAASWTCTAAAGATCPAGGSGSLVDVPVTLAPGAQATFTITATIAPAATGTLTNTASIGGGGVIDPNTDNNTSSVGVALTPVADLSVVKSVDLATAQPGDAVEYTIVVTNGGPSSVTAAPITDTVPAGITAVTWTCTNGAGGTCLQPGGTGNAIATTATLAPNGTVTLTVTGTVAATEGAVTNVAEVAAPTGVTDPDPTDNADDATTSVTPTADLIVTKTAGASTVAAGESVTYAVTVTNAGPSRIVGATLTDPVPSPLTNVAWTCVALPAGPGGSTCETASGTGDLAETLTIAAGGSVTFTVTADVPPTAVAATVTNTATIAMPAGTVDGDLTNNEDSVDVDIVRVADLSVEKVSDPVSATAVPGSPITYRITVTNDGPSAVAGASVTDDLPSTLLSVTWTCSGTAGGTCAASGSGDIADSVTLPVGATVTYVVDATVAATATGTLANTATVAAPAGVTDPVPGNDSSTDSKTLTPQADLSVVKVSQPLAATAVPGEPITYRVTVTNLGPSAVTGATLSDPLPAAIAASPVPSWTCSGTLGGTCAASGTGGIADTAVDLPVGASVTYVLDAVVSSSATGSLVNTATATPPVGVTDPVPGNNDSTDTKALTPEADLVIDKDDNTTTEVPGTTATYTITVTNPGPSDALGATVSDTLPTDLTNPRWSCAAAGGGTCTPGPLAGPLADTVDLPVGAILTYTLTVDIDPAARGTITNVAEVATPAGVTERNAATNADDDVDSLVPQADLSVTKTVDLADARPGDTVVYTIVVSNAGPSAVEGALVDDPMPAQLAVPVTWTCAGTGGSCPATGSGDLVDVPVDLDPLGSVTFTVTGVIAPDATGTATNTVTVAAPTGVTDPDPSDNIADDSTVVSPRANLRVTKTDGNTDALAGTPVTYTIVVGNDGPSRIDDAPVADTVPAAILGATWSCAALAGANCDDATGTGSIATTVDLPSGASVTFTVTGTIDPTFTGTLSNTATVTMPAGGEDTNPLDDASTDTTAVTASADVVVTKTNGATEIVPGTSTSYTVVVRNDGPSFAAGVQVLDPSPAGGTITGWSCTGAACPSPATGTGDLSTVVDLAPNATVTFTVDVDVDADATGPFTNTATAVVPGGIDPNTVNNTDDHTTTLTPRADVTITKTDGLPSAVPGQAITYTVVVTNAGPSDVVGAVVADDLPDLLLNPGWGCVAAGGATCTAGPALGDIADTVDLPVGSSVTYTIVGTFDPAATTDLLNTATVTVTGALDDPADNTATDLDPIRREADLAITKTSTGTAVPGLAVDYTIVVTNEGSSDVVGAAVADGIPSVLGGVTWTCTPPNATIICGSGTGDIADTITLPAGGTITYTVSGTLSPTADPTQLLVNTATVAPPAGVTDVDGTDNSSTVSDGVTPVVALSITKDDGVADARPGDQLEYEIVVANAGPSAAIDARVRDIAPAELGSVTWSCTATPGSSCAASGSGSIDELVDIAPNGSLTFLLSGTIAAGSGTILNTAFVDTPAAATELDTTDNDAQDITDVLPTGDLSVVKTNGASALTPGAAVTYTVTVTNTGLSAAAGVAVSDPLPAGLTAASWTCAPAAGSSCTAGPVAGGITDLANLGAGGSVVYTLSATVDPSATGSVSNVVTITPPAGFDDTNPSNDEFTDTDPLTPTFDLTVAKTDNATVAVPGLPVTYTITVTNSGPSTARATLTDALPATLTGATWSCVPSPGSSCGAGSGSITDPVVVVPGGTLVYTLTADVAPTATGTLTNQVTVTPTTGTDTQPGDNTASDSDTLTPRADLSITKTDAAASSVPGSPVRYSIVVTNGGPSAVLDARVLDTLPAALIGATWTCGTGTGGGTCDLASGTGDVDVTVDLPTGATVTIVLDATVRASQTASVVNAVTVTPPASVTDPDTGNNTAEDTNTVAPAADLSITKTDGVATAVPGTSVTYTVVASNAGPSDAPDALVTDPLPGAIAGATWTCTGAGGATCPATGAGSLAQTVSIPAGGAVTFTVIAAIDPGATGLLVNTASIAPGSVTELDPRDNSATDTDTLVPTADLSIVKTDGLADALPGDQLTYTLTLGNAGPSSVIGAPVTDTIPAELTNAAWSCAPALACTPASGTGDVSSAVDLAPGATATITVTADVVASTLGTVTNVARVDAPATVVDPVPGNNASTDTTVVSPLADVSITKTDGLTTVVAGTPTSYSIIVTNPGPSRLDGVRVVDTVPAALVGTSWSCTPTGGATCPATLPARDLDVLVDMPAASTVEFVLDADVAPAATGTITNVANAALPAGGVDPTPGNNRAEDSTTVLGEADLSITKDDGAAFAVPGSTTTYAVTVSNGGPSDVVDALVSDALPAGASAMSWTCTPGTGAACPVSGSGALVGVPVSIPAGGEVTFAVTLAISPAATGQLVNTASVAVPLPTPGITVTDPDPSDNSATDTDNLVPTADIAVTKTNGATVVIPGTATTYTIVVSNVAGPSTIAGVAVVDPLPAGATGASWTCSAAAGSSCGAASGTGALNTTATVAPGASVTYTVTVQTAVAAGQLTNVVTVTPPVGTSDPDPTNNTATDVDTLQLTADLGVTKLASVTRVVQGDAFSFTVVVTNNGPNPLLGVAVTDPVPAGLTDVRWTCIASVGASCAAPSGTGSIATTVGLAVGATATFVVNVVAALNAPDPVANTVTVAPPAGSVDPDPSNNTATATVAVDRFIPPPAIELSKTTSSTTYALVGQVLRYTLVATNTGGFPLSDVLIADPIAVIGTCSPQMPAVLQPGERLTCDATRSVTQTDLDRGSVTNTATVTSTDPGGETVGAVSQSVTVNATANPALSIVKSTTTSTYSNVGDIVNYSIVVSNTGNVTLDAVTLTDNVATLVSCPPRTLAPGQSMTCAAVRSVTQADLDRGRVDNVATAQAQSASGATVSEVSGVSNLVTVQRQVTGTTTVPTNPTPPPLPFTGADIGGMVSIAAALGAIGVALVAISRRRRPV